MLSHKICSIAATAAIGSLMFAGPSLVAFAAVHPAVQSNDSRYEAIEKLQEQAQLALIAGDYARASKLAKQLLAYNTDTTSWNYGNVLYLGNEIVGLSALHQNDVASAKKSLLAAGASPGSPQLDSFGPDFSLAKALNARGEHAVVLQFLDLVGKFWGNVNAPLTKGHPEFVDLARQQATALAAWKAEIKAGKTPNFTGVDLVHLLPDAKSGGAVAAAPAADTALLANGTVAPDFTVNDRTGKPVHLADYRGRVVVLDFWATWCPPCQASMPHTNEVAHKFAAKNVVVLAVCTSDTQKAFDDWLPKHKDLDAMTFAIDPAEGANTVAGDIYRVSGIPTQFVIGGDGKIVNSFVGYGGPTDDLSNAIIKANAALQK